MVKKRVTKNQVVKSRVRKKQSAKKTVSKDVKSVDDESNDDVSVRKLKPKRTFKKKLDCYTKYRDPLKKDFNKRCGYCDSLWRIVKENYHIDHFAPKSKFPMLETEYSNLVYSCPYCNRSKSNKWPTEDQNKSTCDDKEKGFIDPCLDEYDEHVRRNKSGEIVYKTELGKNIINDLSLFLKRHSIIWKIDKIRDYIDSNPMDKKMKLEALEMLYELDNSLNEDKD